MSIISFRHSAFLFLLFIVMYFYAVYVSDCLFEFFHSCITVSLRYMLLMYVVLYCWLQLHCYFQTTLCICVTVIIL